MSAVIASSNFPDNHLKHVITNVYKEKIKFQGRIQGQDLWFFSY